MAQQKIINKILENFKNNSEGFSFRLFGLKNLNRNDGYMFSISNIKSKYKTITIKTLLNCLKGFNHLKKNLYVGGWFFDGFYYCDISFYGEDLNKCLDYARFFKQISVFDIKNKNCINC